MAGELSPLSEIRTVLAVYGDCREEDVFLGPEAHMMFQTTCAFRTPNLSGHISLSDTGSFCVSGEGFQNISGHIEELPQFAQKRIELGQKFSEAVGQTLEVCGHSDFSGLLLGRVLRVSGTENACAIAIEQPAGGHKIFELGDQGKGKLIAELA